MPVSCHFRDCKSAAGHESNSCKRRYTITSVLTFTFTFITSWKNRLTFGGNPVWNMHFGSLSHFPHHCEIGDFKIFISISHTVTGHSRHRNKTTAPSPTGWGNEENCFIGCHILTTYEDWRRIPGPRVFWWNRRVCQFRQRGGRLDGAVVLHGAL